MHCLQVSSLLSGNAIYGIEPQLLYLLGFFSSNVLFFFPGGFLRHGGFFPRGDFGVDHLLDLG